MDLQQTSESFDTVDWTWLASRHGIGNGHPGTFLLSAFDEATHYPSGRIKPGTLVVRGSGGDAGLWLPFAFDATDDPAVQADAIVLDGARVRKVGGALVATVTAGALMFHGQVVVAKLPGLLDSDSNPRQPTAADLPSGFIGL